MDCLHFGLPCVRDRTHNEMVELHLIFAQFCWLLDELKWWIVAFFDHFHTGPESNTKNLQCGFATSYHRYELSMLQVICEIFSCAEVQSVHSPFIFKHINILCAYHWLCLPYSALKQFLYVTYSFFFSCLYFD